MANWDALTHDIAERFQLGHKAHALIQELLRLIAAERGGIGGFLAKIRAAGFEEKEESWLGEPYPMALSAREVRKALGNEAICQIAKNAGMSEGSVSRILGYTIPKALGLLMEDGAIPEAVRRPAAPAVKGAQMPVHKLNRRKGGSETMGRLAIPGAAVLLTGGVFGYAITSGTAGDHASIQFGAPAVMAKYTPAGGSSVYAANFAAAAHNTYPHAAAASLNYVLGPHTVSGDLRINAGWIENLGAIASGGLGSGTAPAVYAASEFNVGGVVPASGHAWTVGSLYGAEVPQFTVAGIEGTGAPGMRIALLPSQLLPPQENASAAQVASRSKEPAANEAAVSFPTINFAYRSARVPESSRDMLRRVAEQIKQLPPGTRVEVNGYSDSKGRPAFNLKLSQKRARSVYRILVRDGVHPAMLEARGYGSLAPLAGANQTAEGRSSTIRENPRDRRVELRVVSQRQ